MQSVSSESLKKLVYKGLKDSIISGEIPLGTHLVETECAKKYHVSRTPIRAAFNQLISDGIAEYVPGIGLIVKTPKIDDIREIYAIITALSNLMAKHTMQKITQKGLDSMYTVADQIDNFLVKGNVAGAAELCEKIHKAIWDASEMTLCINIMDVLPEFWKYKCLKQNICKGKHVKSILEHRKMIDLIRDKDYDTFCKLNKSHMNDSCNWCIDAYKMLSKNK